MKLLYNLVTIYIKIIALKEYIIINVLYYQVLSIIVLIKF